MSNSVTIALIKQEMKYIPKGRGIQNRLRMIYKAMRHSHLAKLGEKYPARETMKQATALLTKLSSTQPEYDRAFFGGQIA